MDYFNSYEEAQNILRTRNNGLFNLGSTHVGIIGLGAIGSFTASALARSAVGHLTIFDDDTVAPENIGVQDFTVPQIGQYKSDAVEQNCKSINPSLYIQKEHYRVSGQTLPYHLRQTDQTIHVMAVDSMEQRAIIAKAYYEWLNNGQNGTRKNRLLIDARMGGETLQLHLFETYSDRSKKSDDLHTYMDTWYSDEDGDIEPCARRATAYCSSFAGSMITSELVKWVQGNPIRTKSLVFNFPSLLLDVDVVNPVVES